MGAFRAARGKLRPCELCSSPSTAATNQLFRTLPLDAGLVLRAAVNQMTAFGVHEIHLERLQSHHKQLVDLLQERK